MKRFSMLLLFFLLILVGCDKREAKVITFSVGGAPNEVEFWEKIVKDFEKEKKIKINLLRQPTDTDLRRQDLIVPLTAKQNDPDVFLMDIIWIPQFSASGLLEPLNNYIKKDGVNPNMFFKIDRYKDDIAALPVYIDGGLLYYRKDLLEKYGFSPPQTWEELVAISVKIQKEQRKTNKDFYGFVWQGAQYEGLVCTFLEFISPSKNELSENSDSLFTQENIQALKFMYELIHKYKISPPNTFTEMKEEEVRMFFEQGNALFERNWPYAYALHQSEDSKIKDKVGISSLPHFKGRKSASTEGGWHIGISKYSDVKDLAWEFVKFIISYKIQKKLVLELGWNPGRKDLYQDKDVLAKFPHFIILRDVFKNLVTRPRLPYYTQVSEVIQKYVNSSIAGKIAPEKALKKLENEIKKIHKHYQ